jgi:hypothetical protein
MTDRVMDRCGVGWCLTKAQSLPGLSRVWVPLARGGRLLGGKRQGWILLEMCSI